MTDKTDALVALAMQWRHNAQGCDRRDAHAAGTWRSCARELEKALAAPAEGGNLSDQVRLRHPYTGEPRDYRDVNSDPEGRLCTDGGPLFAAQKLVDGWQEAVAVVHYDSLGDARMVWEKHCTRDNRPPHGTKLYPSPAASMNLEQFREACECMKLWYTGRWTPVCPEKRAIADHLLSLIDSAGGAKGDSRERVLEMFLGRIFAAQRVGDDGEYKGWKIAGRGSLNEVVAEAREYLNCPLTNTPQPAEGDGAVAGENAWLSLKDQYSELARAIGAPSDAWFGDPLEDHAVVVARAKRLALLPAQDSEGEAGSA